MTPKKKRKNSYGNISTGVAIGVIVLIGIVAIYFMSISANKPTEVTVSGTIFFTSGREAASPEKIMFTSMKNIHTSYVANAYGIDGFRGNYSINLPNGDSYNVTITSDVGGTADAGTFNLDTNEKEMSIDWAG